jgi:sec-independent protein translocase protein TatB
MLDLGFWELVMIGIVALLVVGPERLPGLAREAGSWVGKAKQLVNSVRADIEREIDSEELKRLLNEQQSEISKLKGMISSTQAQINTDIQEVERSFTPAEDQAVTDAKPALANHEEQTTSTASEISRATDMTSTNDAKRPTGT